MKLIIKNFGPIKNNTQSIDLSKDFFLFVGRNNSGKTYVAHLLWTIFNQDIINKFAKNSSDLIEHDFLDNKEEVEVTEELINKILNAYTCFIKEELKKSTFNIIKQTEILDNISVEFSYKISNLEKLPIKSFNTITWGGGDKIDLFSVEKSENSLLFKFEEQNLPEDISLLKKLKPKESKEADNKSKKSSLIEIIIFLLLKHEHQTFFLPASRSFFPIFYRYIYEIERKNYEKRTKEMLTLIKNNESNQFIQFSELREKINLFERNYTEPMNKVFEKLYSLNSNQEINNQEFYVNLIQEMQEIFGGEIKLINQEGIANAEFYLKLDTTDNNLPMYLASSSINQLTLLYLYFKYWVSEKNNFLLIDEPEENLHPENQINLLNILLKFVTKKPNKVLITTHSSILANAINNYVYLDVLKNKYKIKVEKVIEEHNLKYVDSSIAISQENVGVYFFTGDKIIDYESDDYGIYFRNFREVENNLDKSLRILSDYIYHHEDDCENE